MTGPNFRVMSKGLDRCTQFPNNLQDLEDQTDAVLPFSGHARALWLGLIRLPLKHHRTALAGSVFAPFSLARNQ